MVITQTTLVAGLFVLLGFGFVVFGSFRLLAIFDSQSWPKTVGQVYQSRVVEHTDSDGDTTYNLEFRYAYKVGDDVLHGHKVSLKPLNMQSGYQLNQLTQRYPEGTRVRVYYDPKRPHNAVLEQARLSDAVPLIVLGFLFIFGSIVAAALMPF